VGWFRNVFGGKSGAGVQLPDWAAFFGSARVYASFLGEKVVVAGFTEQAPASSQKACWA